ncbi:MAG TPA: DUF1328 domain-containing protein [Candidatus Eisenbacteria bacterium]|nr:DUF1328 domain-containing protein [Candidatus Eisenbacteria bacterium]
MLRWSLVFFIIALVAGALGLTGISAGAALVAKTLFFIFLTLCLVTLAIGGALLSRLKRL